jgi:hypothetical protein
MKTDLIVIKTHNFLLVAENCISDATARWEKVSLFLVTELVGIVGSAQARHGPNGSQTYVLIRKNRFVGGKPQNFGWT